MRRWLRRILLLLGGALVVLELLYLVGANYCLNASWVQALANRRPEKFSMRWGWGWSVWPRGVHLRDVEMRGSSANFEWYARLETVAASYRIRPFFERRADLRSVSVGGVDYRQRRRSGPGEAAGSQESDLPPLPPIDAPAGKPPAPPSAAKPPKEPWTITAEAIDADIDQLWFDRLKLAGSMNVTTSLKLVVRGPMELPDVRFTMSDGTLTQGDRPMLAGLSVEAETALPPFVPKGLKGVDIFRLMDGRFQVRSESTGLGFLEPYFKGVDWLHFEGKSAVRADLRLSGGRIQAGSTFEADPADINMIFLDRRLLGRGRIVGEVNETADVRHSSVEVLLPEFALAAEEGGEPYAHGRGFHVTATSSVPDFVDPLSALEVTADLPEVVVPDISWYNRYIPDGAAISLTSGTGRLEYHVKGSREEGSLHGQVLLSADDVVMMFEGYEMRGDVRIDLALEDIQARAGRFDVSGTKIDVNSDKFPWQASIMLPKAQVSFSRPMKIDASIAMTMTDTTPIVAMFDARKDISNFVEKLMTIRDIDSTALFAVAERGIEIRDLSVDGQGLQVLADLALREGGKDGLFYIKYHHFSVGLELKGGKKDLDLVRARKWFEKRRAERNAAP